MRGMMRATQGFGAPLSLKFGLDRSAEGSEKEICAEQVVVRC